MHDIGAVLPPDEAKKELGSRLRTARDEVGFTQQEVADLMGITKGGLSSWEVGRTTPDALTLAHIARIYETSTDVLLGHRVSPAKPRAKR